MTLCKEAVKARYIQNATRSLPFGLSLLTLLVMLVSVSPETVFAAEGGTGAQGAVFKEVVLQGPGSKAATTEAEVPKEVGSKAAATEAEAPKGVGSKAAATEAEAPRGVGSKAATTEVEAPRGVGSKAATTEVEAPKRVGSKAAASKVKKPGKAEKKVPLVITSDSLEADNNKGIVLFRGNVIAEEKFLLCSDELFIGYGKGAEVDKIVATGNVRIIHGSKVAGSDRAEYIKSDSKLLLTGSAVIVECGDTLRGERIEVFLDEDRAVVDGGKGKRVRAFIQPEKSCKDETPGVGKKEDGKEMDGESRCRWAGQVLR